MTSRGIWMEQSLERSAKLSLDVLKRAKRRKVHWPDEFNIQKLRAQDQGFYYNADQNVDLENSEDERKRLDAAFSTVMEFMAHTTEQCEQYYSNTPFSSCSKNEVNHVCRYHNRNLVATSQKPKSTLKRACSRDASSSHPQPEAIQREQIRRQPVPCSGAREAFSGFTVSSPGGRSNSKDVLIEVTPGTYSISACSHGLEQKSKFVNITPGQSVDVVFIT